MTREEAIANLNMINVAFVEPVTKEQRKLIDDTFDMAIQALSQEPTDENLHREREQAYMQGYEDASKRFRQEPCSDAISRDAVKDWFCTNYCSEHNQCEHFEQGDCNAMIELFAIPSVTQKSGKWIPVSERLPEDEQEILFSTKTGRVHSGKYHDDDSANQWYSHRDKCRAWNNVVSAWMPLPKPYELQERSE